MNRSTGQMGLDRSASKGAALLLSLLLMVHHGSLGATPAELVVQTGHTGPVEAVGFTHDGEWVVSGSMDNTLKLWDAERGLELRTFVGHTGPVTSLSITPDGSHVLSGSWDHTVRLWEIATGREVLSLPGLVATSVVVVPDGNSALVGDWSGAVTLWDLTRREELRTFADGGTGAGAVAFSPDGRFAVSCIKNEPMTLWDVSNGTLINAFPKPSKEATCVAFSPDGRYVLSAGKDKKLRLWDAAHATLVRTFAKGHSDFVSAVAFSPDGHLVASSSHDATVRLWDISNGKVILSLAGHSPLARSVCFTPDGQHVLAGVGDGTMRLWDISSGQLVRVFEGVCAGVIDMICPADGNSAVAIGADGMATMWDLREGRELHTVGTGGRTVSADCSPDGRWVVMGRSDDTVELWDVANERQIDAFSGLSGDYRPVAVAPEGQYVAYRGGRGAVVLREAAGGRTVKTLNPGVECQALRFSPDGQLLLSAHLGGLLKLWEVPSGRSIGDLVGIIDFAISVAFSSNGRMVIAGDTHSTARVWELTGMQLLHELRGHDTFVTAVALSHDTRMAVTGDLNGVAKIWDLLTEETIQTLTGHTAEVSSVVFSPDDRIVLTGSRDGSIKLWDITTGEELAERIRIGAREWVILLPDGRFDGSPGGYERMHLVEGFQSLPLDAFFERNYTPKLLLQALSGQDLPAPVADLTEGVNFAPLVRIRSPIPGQEFTSPKVTVTVSVTDRGAGIDEVRLYQNGKLMSDDARGLRVEPRTGHSIERAYEVLLTPGPNEFRAIALNRSRVESNPATITVRLAAPSAQSRLFLVGVGISEYENTIYNLNYGVRDAEALIGALAAQSAAIFREITTFKIYDSEAVRPTIQRALDEVMRASGPGDAFVFFYAGHGAMSEGDELTPSDFFLIPHDVTQLYGNDAVLIAKGISGTELREWCRQIPAQKQLLILDSCQAGGAVDAFAYRGTAEQKAMEQLARSSGVIVLASAGTEQFATEVAHLGHGLYTYALLEGLAGRADGGVPGDGKITVNELQAFLCDRVPELTKEYRGRAQYPTAYAKGQDFPVAVCE